MGDLGMVTCKAVPVSHELRWHPAWRHRTGINPPSPLWEQGLTHLPHSVLLQKQAAGIWTGGGLGCCGHTQGLWDSYTLSSQVHCQASDQTDSSDHCTPFLMQARGKLSTHLYVCPEYMIFYFGLFLTKNQKKFPNRLEFPEEKKLLLFCFRHWFIFFLGQLSCALRI